MDAPDIIYPVRPGDNNEELRYSLRSLTTNYPHHGNVWIVGHKPSWVTGANYIPGNNANSPQANLWHNIHTACRHPDISDNIVVMNDDFYITQPVDKIPVLYRGTLADHIKLPRVQRGEQWWRESLKTTLAALREHGHANPLSYELHTPYPCDKTQMADTLHKFRHVTPENPPQWRTLHGVTHNIPATQHEDGKAYRPGPISQPYHSTDDRTYRYFRGQLQEMFPRPSPYEVN